MARELGLNPRKFGSLANEQQAPWKRPLAEFIAHCYCKRFGRTTPENVQSLEDVVKRAEARRSERRARKKNRTLLGIPVIFVPFTAGKRFRHQTGSPSESNMSLRTTE